MRKAKVFLILGIVFILLSVAAFKLSERELENPNCKPGRCYYEKYTDAFLRPIPFCFKICITNTNSENFTVHGYSFVIFVWLGVLSLIISLVYYLKERKK